MGCFIYFFSGSEEEIERLIVALKFILILVLEFELEKLNEKHTKT